uniref:ARID domain-containing protein n=1 Tax=Oreochromis aureus TaxID=47969 RepID=A0A668RU96_OREAU
GYEGRASVVQMEEKAFVSSLHSFMKEKGTPIERIPHLGFKQINLWKIYKAVDKLGGYDSVTARRLWKKVYDELGGSPGSTSAATCTRRHYERLVLPFERHIKGEEDKPLPPSKPRKPYKRNLDGKMTKAEGKRKRTHSDRDIDSEVTNYNSDKTPNREVFDILCSKIPPPLCLSVTHPEKSRIFLSKRSSNSSSLCSLARASSSRNCNSSDGSPLPLSSSSSRSPSPYSVSSEEGPAGGEDKAASSSEMSQNASVKNPSGCSEDSKTVSKTHKEPKGQNKDVSQIGSDSIKNQVNWKSNKGASKHYPLPFQLPTSYSVKSVWAPTSTSSFTKVIPKPGNVLRPTPVRPSYKNHTGRLLQQDDSLTCAKRMSMWSCQTEKREKSRTMQQKVPPAQQSLSYSAATLPLPCVLSGYEKTARDSRHQPPLHPSFIPNRMRLPPSQLMYRNVPMGPPPSALIGSALYSYPYPIPLLNPQTAYAIPAINPIYPQKL